MARHTLGDDRSVEDVQRGEERGRPVPLVVVRQRSRPALLHRQARLRPVERLNLALLVDAEHQAVFGGIQVEAHHIAHLLVELRVSTELKRAHQMRFQPCACQMRCTAAGLIRCAFAIVRTLHWVAPLGRSWRVASTTARILVSVSGGLPRPRGRSRWSAASPSLANRSRQSKGPSCASDPARSRSRCWRHRRRHAARSGSVAPSAVEPWATAPTTPAAGAGLE